MLNREKKGEAYGMFPEDYISKEKLQYIIDNFERDPEIHQKARDLLYEVVLDDELFYFNVPFGEWEKIPRLQAKTLVGLRCHGKLPQDLTFRLRSEIPPGMDHQVPQAGFLWRRGRSVTGTHP